MNDSFEKTWCRLTDNQRICLINAHVPYDQKVAVSHFIAGDRALTRLGLWRTPAARELATWARERGYARYDNGTWVFSQPGGRHHGKIDPARLVELVDAGLHKSQIAEQLGVSRQAVAYAVKRHGLTAATKPKKPKPVRQPRVPRPHRLAFAVSKDELAAIEQGAGQQGMSVSAYLRRRCTEELS